MPNELTSDQAATLASAVVASQKGTLIDTADPVFRTALDVLRGLDFVVPGAGTAASQVIDAVTVRSLTVPGPAGPLVVVGRDDSADPVRHAVAATEQAVTANLMNRIGGVQSMVDLLGSGELRAARLATVAIAGCFVRFLLDGHLPEPDAIVDRARELAGALSLDDRDMANLRANAVMALEELRDGERPNITAAGVALKWLREHASDAIAAPGWR